MTDDGLDANGLDPSASPGDAQDVDTFAAAQDRDGEAVAGRIVDASNPDGGNDDTVTTPLAVVVIGAGTNGTRTATRAHQLATDHPRLPSPDAIDLLVADTKDFAPEDVPGGACPAHHQRLSLGPLDVSDLLERARRGGRVGEMVDLDTVGVGGTVDQALQQPPLGALAFDAAYDELKSRLSQTVQRLLNHERFRDLAPDQVPKVLFVDAGSSLGSGTGAPGLAFRRAAVQEVMDGRGASFSYHVRALLPPANGDPGDVRALENAAARLIEAEQALARQADGHAIEVHTTDGTVEIPATDPFIDRFSVMGDNLEGGVAHGSLEQLVEHAAMVTALEALPPTASSFKDALADVASAGYPSVTDPDGDDERLGFLRSEGLQTLHPCRSRMLESVAAHAAADGLEAGHLAAPSDVARDRVRDGLPSQLPDLDDLVEQAMVEAPTRLDLKPVMDNPLRAVPDAAASRVETLMTRVDEARGDLGENAVRELAGIGDRVANWLDEHVRSKPGSVHLAQAGTQAVLDTLADAARQLENEVEELAEAEQRAQRELERARKRLRDRREAGSLAWRRIVGTVVRPVHPRRRVERALAEVERAARNLAKTRLRRAVKRDLYEAVQDVEAEVRRLSETLVTEEQQLKQLAEHLRRSPENRWRDDSLPMDWPILDPSDVPAYHERYRDRLDIDERRLALNAVPYRPGRGIDTNEVASELEDVMQDAYEPMANRDLTAWIEEALDVANRDESSLKELLRALPGRSRAGVDFSSEIASSKGLRATWLFAFPEGQNAIQRVLDEHVGDVVPWEDPERILACRIVRGLPVHALAQWPQLREAYQEAVQEDETGGIHVLRHLVFPGQQRLVTVGAAIAHGLVTANGRGARAWRLAPEISGTGEAETLAQSWEAFKQRVREDDELGDRLDRALERRRRSLGEEAFAEQTTTGLADLDVPATARPEIRAWVETYWTDELGRHPHDLPVGGEAVDEERLRDLGGNNGHDAPARSGSSLGQPASDREAADDDA